jgi:hypothetical protein
VAWEQRGRPPVEDVLEHGAECGRTVGRVGGDAACAQATAESVTISRRSLALGSSSWRRTDWSSSRVASSRWMRIMDHRTAVPR